MIDPGGSLTERAVQRRHVARHKMFGPVALSFGGAEARAHFLDLSCAGALAHCETPPVVGCFVSIRAPGLRTHGRVIWASGKRFGIQFSELLTPEEMDALIQGA